MSGASEQKARADGASGNVARDGAARASSNSSAAKGKGRPFPIAGHVAIVALFAVAVSLAVAAMYKMFPDDATAIGFLGFLLVVLLTLGAAADAIADRFFGSEE
jgi:hypothetical protein